MSAVLSADSGSKSAPAPAASMPAVRLDFAHVAEDRLLLHGWCFGLTTDVAGAEVYYGTQVHNLLRAAVVMPRADVTHHFLAAGIVSHSGDEHGFHATFTIDDTASRYDSLRLVVCFHSGEIAESFWAVSRGETPLVEFCKQNPPTLKWLLAHLSPTDLEPLCAALPPAPKCLTAVCGANAPSFQLGVDLCCVLEGHLLLILGWCQGLDEASTTIELSVGSSTWDFLGGRVLMERPDLESGGPTASGQRETPRRLGFIFLAEMAGRAAAGDSAQFEIFSGAGSNRARCSISRDSNQARHDLLALLRKFELDALIESIERIYGQLRESPDESALRDLLIAEHRAAVERLPTTLQSSSPRFCLYVDSAFPVVDAGIFLHGWFEAEAGAHRGVTFHTGFDFVRIDDDWVRHHRADVTTHLAQAGVRVAGHDHGFSSYITVKGSRGPYFIALTSSDTTVRRMRLSLTAPPVDPLATVRELFKSFNTEHRDLLGLLDRQIGPAVHAVWSRRSRVRNALSIQRFGSAAADPRVSIIVPLYGRHDFAEYQQALFADDPEFQNLELLYFVDDPKIYREFLLCCHDLQQLYGVPFAVLFAGENLGFAAANNRAAEVARGNKLILLNSDVFPKRPGWVGALARIHDALESPGLLGVKLLYEDGSVQHVGMSFRRYPGWGDMWINYHPHKGQSPVGLQGVHEVEAVTAACVMVDRDLYRELGGLSEDYIIGDFEDSDLCLRATAAGRRNRVALDIELFHLERQSQNHAADSQWRTNLTVYNCWQHHRRWAGIIERGVA